MAPPKPKHKVMVLSDWPVYMWLVSAVYLSLALWSAVKLQQGPA